MATETKKKTTTKKEAEAPKSVETPKEVEAPKNTEAPKEAEAHKVKVNVPLLNVRKEPNLDAEILRVLKKDEVIELETTADGWGKLLGEEAWVCLEFVVEEA